jgi:hypothetical protein
MVSSATAKIGETFAVIGRVSRPEHNGQSTSRFGCRSFQYTQQKKWSYIVDENLFPKHPILDGHTEINVWPELPVHNCRNQRFAYVHVKIRSNGGLACIR